MTDQELKDLVASLAVKSDRLDEQMKRNDERLTAKLERIGITLGNIGNNQGAVAEEFFYNSLKSKQTLAGVHYDFIDKNLTRSQGSIEDEFDIMMVNGKDVAIIEVKYKAHEADLTKLLTKKYENFKKLFPMYKDYTHHLVLATFSLYEDLKEKALANGVIVLQRKGDVIESFVPS
jgi:Holliday junction resolvase-like predicted endonuclease